MKTLIGLVFIILSTTDLYAGTSQKFDYYDKLLISDSIRWFQDINSATIESLKMDESELHKKILGSNFHTSAGALTCGSLLDFLTGMGKIDKTVKIEMITSNFERKTVPPYSLQNPLFLGHCYVKAILGAGDGKKKSYRFKFLYYSDAEKLKQMAKENGFPNADSMDDNTFLIALEEEVTESYPDGFHTLDASGFSGLLSASLNGIHQLKDYLDIRR